MDSVAALVADSFFLESEIYVKQGMFDIQEYSLVKYDAFFEKHGITKEIFIQNVRYYITHNKYAGLLINKIDEIVEQRVSALRDSLEVVR